MITIAVPHRGVIEAETVQSLFRLGQYNYHQATLALFESTYIDMARQELVTSALMARSTHILFVDSDMTFPADALHQLLNWEQMVVGVNYRRRRAPHEFTASWDGKPVTSIGQKGLSRVTGMGFGLVLIRLSVFRTIQQPWFAMSDQYEGEDTVFCQRCEQAGIPLYIDHTLSQSVGHIGKQVLTV